MLEYLLLVWYKKGSGTFGVVPKIGFLKLRKHLSFGSWEGGAETMKARALMVSKLDFETTKALKFWQLEGWFF
jgi:hypothetical protein